MSSPATKTDFGRQLIRNYEIGRRMIASLAEDFTEDEAALRVDEHKPLVWFLAHLAVSEAMLLKLYFGQASPLSREMHDRFGRGSDGDGDFTIATKTEMLEVLGTLRDRVREALGPLTYDDMAREPERPIDHPAFNNLGTAVALISAHNAYHAGQIALLRRAMGKSAQFG